MRAAQGAQVDYPCWLLPDKIDDREGVECAEAEIRDVGGAAVGRGNHLVGIVAHGNPRQHVQAGRIDNGQGVVLLGQGEKRRR